MKFERVLRYLWEWSTSFESYLIS